MHGISISTVDQVVRSYQRDRWLLPVFTVANELMRQFARAAVARQPGSHGAKRLLSSLHDMNHAIVAGVYCDIFNCDAETARWIRALRLARNLPNALTQADAGGDGALLAEMLERAVNGSGVTHSA